MKKEAMDIKIGDKIKIGGKTLTVEELEASDIGKQGKRKFRIVAKSDTNEKVVIIRPEDYPFETCDE